MPLTDVYAPEGSFADRRTAAGVLADRTWVLLAESSEGAWRVAGRADRASDLAPAARSELAAITTTAKQASGRCS
jgi:hypothetical protein